MLFFLDSFNLLEQCKKVLTNEWIYFLVLRIITNNIIDANVQSTYGVTNYLQIFPPGKLDASLSKLAVNTRKRGTERVVHPPQQIFAA